MILSVCSVVTNAEERCGNHQHDRMIILVEVNFFRDPGQ